MKKPLKVSIYTQKGGVGKSTITTLLASAMHYRLGYNVLIIDCDFPQYSLSNMRDRDKVSIMNSDYHKKVAMKQFQAINKKAYPIIKAKAEIALETAVENIDQQSVKPDIVFFDLPGTANTKGVLTALQSMDYIFSPITADRLVVESTLAFSKAFLQLPTAVDSSKDQALWLFWNQVDGREKTGLYKTYTDTIQELGLLIMKAGIRDSKRFRKETDDTINYVFRSSLLPAESQLLKLTNFDLFISEFLRIVHL